MIRLWYSEAYYTDVMKTLCNYLNRLWGKRKGKTIIRDVKYWSGKYHYTEEISGVIIFSQSEKSPMALIKQIIERENQKLY
jgi:hypothetical protein